MSKCKFEVRDCLFCVQNYKDFISIVLNLCLILTKKVFSLFKRNVTILKKKIEYLFIKLRIEDWEIVHEICKNTGFKTRYGISIYFI